MSITQPHKNSVPSEHSQASADQHDGSRISPSSTQPDFGPSTSPSTPLKSPEPQKCCSGGNCAECGKQQPVVESSAEIAAIEQQILSGDFTSFFDSLSSSREELGKTVGIEAVVVNGDDSVLQVGKTGNTFGTIGPSESARRYFESPSPALATGTGVTTAAEKLVSIGSVPKQAAMGGAQPTTSLRDSIPSKRGSTVSATPGETRQGPAPYQPQTERRAEQPSSGRVVERETAKQSTVDKVEKVREVEKVAVAKVERLQERSPEATRPPPSSSVRAASSTSTPTQTPLTSYRTPVSPLARPSQPSSAETRSFRTGASQRSISLGLSRSVARNSPNLRDGGLRAAVPRAGGELKALIKSQNLIANLERTARALVRGGVEASSAKASQQVSRALQSIDRLVRNSKNAALRSPTDRAARAELRSVARALPGARGSRENRAIGRVMLTALRKLSGGVERRMTRFSVGRRGSEVVSSRSLTRKALLSARLQTIRGRLERITARFQSKSFLERRVGLKRGLSARALVRRTQSKNQLIRRSSSRQSRKSSTRQATARRQTKSSTRRRSATKSERQRQEVRMLRREVNALRQSLQDIVPMLEMMKAVSAKRRGLGREEEFDLRGLISEKQLAALLKRKNLSSLEKKKIERELAKKKKAKGAAGPVKSAATASKKQSGSGATASAKPSEGQDKQQDAEMKSYAKTLSTFLMRTDDSADDDDDSRAFVTE